MIVFNDNKVLPFEISLLDLPLVVTNTTILVIQRIEDKESIIALPRVYLYDLEKETAREIYKADSKSTVYTVKLARKDNSLFVSDRTNLYQYELNGNNPRLLYSIISRVHEQSINFDANQKDVEPGKFRITVDTDKSDITSPDGFQVVDLDI
jgi:tRNA U34 2-thiouridine synthase MnmA/TrmU